MKIRELRFWNYDFGYLISRPCGLDPQSFLNFPNFYGITGQTRNEALIKVRKF